MKKSILSLALISMLGLGAVSSVFAEDPAPAPTAATTTTAPATTAAPTPTANTADTQAQRDAKMAEHIDKRISRMKENLNLTEDQAAQLKTILTEQHAKREGLRSETETRITGILTSEQATKLKSFRDEHRGFGMDGRSEGKGRHGGHHRDGHGGDCGNNKPAE